MIVSQMIELLQQLKDKHGDVEVVVPGSVDDDWGTVNYWDDPTVYFQNKSKTAEALDWHGVADAELDQDSIIIM